jgi:hypothetical protein
LVQQKPAAAADQPQRVMPSIWRWISCVQLGSDIGQLETFDDDEQPLPQNVSSYCKLCHKKL